MFYMRRYGKTSLPGRPDRVYLYYRQMLLSHLRHRSHSRFSPRSVTVKCCISINRLSFPIRFHLKTRWRWVTLYVSVVFRDSPWIADQSKFKAPLNLADSPIFSCRHSTKLGFFFVFAFFGGNSTQTKKWGAVDKLSLEIVAPHRFLFDSAKETQMID